MRMGFHPLIISIMKKDFDFAEYFKNNKVILAPMAGVTTFAYRTFMSKFGTAIEVSEMISDCGLIYGNKETESLIYSDNNEHFLSIQLFGGDVNQLVEGIKILETKNINYKVLDINLGCPVPKVTRNNGGSSWLKDLDKLEKMMKEVVKTSSKPVSAKIRLGWDDSSINVYETAKILENCGVSFITIHCRTTKQGYTGKARYEEISKIKEVVNIPVIVSGDIFTYEDALKALKITHCDGVAVARGAIGNPLLIKEINDALSGKEVRSARNFEEQKEFLIEYMDALIAEKGEELAIRYLRGISSKFFSGFENSRSIRSQLSAKTFCRQDVIDILNANDYKI